MHQLQAFIVAMLLLFLNLASSVSAEPTLTEMTGRELPEAKIVTVLRSFCAFGLYIDDAGQGLGNWDTYLYLSNINNQQAHGFDIFVSFIDAAGVPQVTSRSFVLATNQLRVLSCVDLGACDTQGWLGIYSDTPVMGATVLLVQPSIPGAITAQPPTGCAYNLAP